MQAYCGKCRTRREVVDPVVTPNPHGGNLVKGTCAICGSKIRGFVVRGSAQMPAPGERT